MSDERQSERTHQDRDTPTSGDMTDRMDDKGRSIAEWTTLAISTAILIGIVGAITWLSFRGDERPPSITAEPQFDQLREEPSGFYLPVVIHNAGDMTVEDALIHGKLDSGDGEPELVDLTITFLAGGERVNGTLIFQQDPTEGELTTSVASYKDP